MRIRAQMCEITISCSAYGSIKMLTVYVAEVAADTLQAYKPDLATDEHSDWHWFKVDAGAKSVYQACMQALYCLCLK